MTEGEGTVTVRIRRTTIEAGDPSAVTELLGNFARRGPEKKRNRIRFEVEGYGDDPRELFEIGDVREFFRRLFDENEGLFYWMDPHSDTFMLLGLMLYEPERESETAGLGADDLRAYLTRGLEGLDRFCSEHGVPGGEAERAIAGLVKGKLGS